ncbi:inactive protein RESTRICTED TEV MOVEMENT 2-like [Durio zibethinus]|uniref:Inactive protein RESTRICTED TEV MOVEMENT 2-like n=1 Tax=Durio zibethinus TaxID=66656 RepID=A0A6P5ZV29_DURZI|nr:inactive protein RESTRICTED TEV MOVEMENT 2-like [Durio zibethinus]
MDSKPTVVYEDFELRTEWVHEAVEDTLIAYLPGFTKAQLKVQVTTAGNLRIYGERPIGGNKFSRFSKEIPIPSNCDQNKIRANFKDGMLHIKHSKLIIPADEKQEEAKPSVEVPKSDQNHAPQPPRPADVPRKLGNGPEQAVQETPLKATVEKQTGEKTDGLAKEADSVSEKEPDKEKEMKDKSNAGNGSDKPMEEERKGWDQEEKASTSEKAEKFGDSVQDTAEKENVETEKLDGTDHKYQPAINVLSLKYKQVLDGLAMGLKNPRKMMNMVLAVLLVVVLAVYVRNAIRSLRNY